MSKKHNRVISVNDEVYIWYLKNNEIWTPNKYIIIRHSDYINGQRLYLSPYSWHFEIRPRTIREAIIFGVANGWNPKESGEPIYLGYNKNGFVILPPNVFFTDDL